MDIVLICNENYVPSNEVVLDQYQGRYRDFILDLHYKNSSIGIRELRFEVLVDEEVVAIRHADMTPSEERVKIHYRLRPYETVTYRVANLDDTSDVIITNMATYPE